jgi:SAM-dependent methyltransferase
LKKLVFNLLKKLFSPRALKLFWCLYWYGEELKEARELGFKSKIPIRGSERATLIETLLSGEDKTFLEVGFGYGQNLHVLREFISSENIFPLELNKERVLATKESLPDLPYSLGDILSLPYQDKSIDVVFTSAVLLYLNSSDVQKALLEMMRVARKRVVILEQECSGDDQELSGGVVGGTYWVRDYQKLLRDLSPTSTISPVNIKNPRWPIESWETMGLVLDVLLK